MPRDLLGSYVKTLTESQELIKNAREIMETLLEADNVCSECFAKISGDKEKEKGAVKRKGKGKSRDEEDDDELVGESRSRERYERRSSSGRRRRTKSESKVSFPSTCTRIHLFQSLPS